MEFDEIKPTYFASSAERLSPPVFTRKPQDKETKENQRTRIDVVVKGEPLPDVTWSVPPWLPSCIHGYLILVYIILIWRSCHIKCKGIMTKVLLISQYSRFRTMW